MDVVKEITHKDGSATYVIDMSEEERELVTKQGLLWMMVSGITGYTADGILQKYITDQALDELVRQREEMNHEV